MTTTRRIRRTLVLAIPIVVLSLAIAQAPAGADTDDAVRTWNLNASNALFNLPTASPPGAGQALPGQLHLAMVQGAVYDAVMAIDGRYEPYLEGLPDASSTASIDAAVATAAHDVLVGLTNPETGQLVLAQVTRDWLDDAYDDSLAGITDGADKTAGIEIGAAAAEAMLDERDDDGRYEPFSFSQGTGIGEWRDTGSGSDPSAWVANVRPFLIESTSQFRTDGPYPVDSRRYAKQYAEVKAVGSLDSASRTDEQTALALFYRESAIVLWNRTFRSIAEDRELDAVDEARLFAMLNLIGADAAINCWDDKAHWSFWRPVTAIQLGDQDDNPETVGDPDWTPLGAPTDGLNPPYPDHPSGYNCITGAMMRAARDFFGTTHIAFTVHSNSSNTDRTYSAFPDAFKDTIEARIYLGIHFRRADVQGRVLGRDVAAWASGRYFEPVD